MTSMINNVMTGAVQAAQGERVLVRVATKIFPTTNAMVVNHVCVPKIKVSRRPITKMMNPLTTKTPAAVSPALDCPVVEGKLRFSSVLVVTGLAAGCFAFEVRYKLDTETGYSSSTVSIS